jgi:hypothetical protein
MKEQDLEQYSENSAIYKCFGNGFALTSFTYKFYLSTCKTSVRSYSYIILNVIHTGSRSPFTAYKTKGCGSFCLSGGVYYAGGGELCRF